MKTNTWITIKDESLAVYARNAGFDLAIYKGYSLEVKQELRRRTINEAINGIRASFEDEAGFALPTITKGFMSLRSQTPFASNIAIVGLRLST